jgi:hypothetical protein
MTMRTARPLSLVLAVLFLVLVTSQPVWAADPVTLELKAPERVALGEKIEVESLLLDGTGKPVPAASVVLYSGANFLSTSGNVQLGRTATDAHGMARFSYQARTEGEITLNASFLGDDRYGAAQASIPLVVEGSAQLTRHPVEGVRVPGIGPWILAGILGGVWSTYLAVMAFLALIAREGANASTEARVKHG